MNRLTKAVSIATVLAVFAAFCLFTAGCAKAPTQTTATTLNSAAPLPDWAPDNPSPEFLRAARVFKPIPDEALASLAEKAPTTLQAALARYNNTLLPAWELFGSFSDEQIEKFVSSHSVKIPVKSMTPKQRALLDNWFESWRQAMRGTDEMEDFLVILYKKGANEDLSNVSVGFVNHGASINMHFWITKPDGTVSDQSNTVAML